MDTDLRRRRKQWSPGVGLDKDICTEHRKFGAYSKDALHRESFLSFILSFLNNLESILDRISKTTEISVLVSFLSWFDLPLLNTSEGLPLIFRAAGFTALPGT